MIYIWTCFVATVMKIVYQIYVIYFDLKNVITLPSCFKTPRGTLLDVILTPNIKCLQTHGAIDTGLSDYHRIIYMVTKVHTPKPQKRQVTKRSLKSLNVK